MLKTEVCHIEDYNISTKEIFMFRIGNGYDVHRLIEDKSLIIGGVDIPYEKGLLGHSDADVLVHAIMDALLGACGERDIGNHFPDTDNLYKGISSLKLLSKVREIIESKSYKISNIDSIIVAQAPKMSPHIDKMKQNIAETLGIAIEDINIKATTTEGLGFAGTGEGIASYAVACLYKA
jgi:2-C-methyl-D-erythritol 2,4-cyclodiphosphate synthase